LEALEESHNVGIGASVVISAGFAERGADENVARQQDLRRFSEQSGFRICGPNCLGVANVTDNAWLCAADATALPGRVSLISQSGAMAFSTIVPRAREIGLGLRYIVSTGNEVDLGFESFLHFLIDDPETDVIAGYVEGFKSPKKLLELATLAGQQEKPIVLIKVGRSNSGRAAAMSHTAALTGDDQVYDAMFDQYGITRVNDYDELLEVTRLFSLAKQRRCGNRIAVVSHSGGVAALTADVLEASGLKIPGLGERCTQAIEAVVANHQGTLIIRNPLDISNAAKGPWFRTILEQLVNDRQVEVVVVASGVGEQQASDVEAVQDGTDKLLLFLWTGRRMDEAEQTKLKTSRIPFFYRPTDLAKGLRLLLEYRRWSEVGLPKIVAYKDHGDGKSIRKRMFASGVESAGQLSEYEAKLLLAHWGIAVGSMKLTTNEDESVSAANSIGYPVTLKVVANSLAHKSDVGGVICDLRTEADVRRAFATITGDVSRNVPQANIQGILVTEHIGESVEMIVGFTQADIGTMLMLGFGGTSVEIYDDLARCVCPISTTQVMDMLSTLKGSKLLYGFRGQPMCDLDALAETVSRLSTIVTGLGSSLLDLEINPLMVRSAGNGVVAADALVRFGDPSCGKE